MGLGVGKANNVNLMEVPRGRKQKTTHQTLKHLQAMLKDLENLENLWNQKQWGAPVRLHWKQRDT
jgi:hypothetical protein